MIKVNSVLTEISYSVSYSNPLLNLASEKNRQNILNKIMSSFNVRLNDVKFSAETPSDRFFHFQKFLDRTSLKVSLGVEELSVKIINPKDEADVYTLLNKVLNLVKSLKGFNIGHQRISISENFSTDDDFVQHFNSLNPFTPDEFEESLKSKGVIYRLVDNEYGCNIFIVMDKSIIAIADIYLNIDLQFSPNKLSFQDMSGVVKERYPKITSALGLEIANRWNYGSRL